MAPLPTDVIKNIVKEYGTPTYVYQKYILEAQYLKLKNALSGLDAQICYAVKANSNLTILNRLARLGSGFDIVSGGELHRVRAAGGDIQKTVFAGVGKTKEEIQLGLASNIRFFNVESIEELHHIESIASEMSTTACVSFRINPNISVETHPYLATGINESKFGIALNDISQLYDSIKNSKHLKLVAVDCHIGSQISDINPYQTALTQLLSIAAELSAKGAPINTIDLGGGLGVSFSGQYEPINLDLYGQMITKHMAGSGYSLIVEPGKFLVTECGSLVTQVLYKKKNADREFLITDAGMNDLMRPSLYQAYHHMDVIGKESNPLTHSYDIGGPVCESGCMMATNRPLPHTESQDLIAIRDAGAYGFSMASNYNTRTRPAEVLIESDGSFNLIRRREDIKHLISDEELESLHF
jgi:diaminopimelate decarboxylase